MPCCALWAVKSDPPPTPIPTPLWPRSEIPLDKFIGTATATMYMAYTSSFTLAAKLEVQAGGGFGDMVSEQGSARPKMLAAAAAAAAADSSPQLPSVLTHTLPLDLRVAKQLQVHAKCGS